MNLNQLYYFKKLAQLQHFTQAAKELYITQPSLSGSISSLEEELGVELFHRQGRNIKLTKYGEEFYKYVCTALNELEKGIEVAKENAGTLGGVIDVGCIPTLIGDFLPMAIKRYSKTVNSKTKFNIFNGMTLDIIEGIKSGKYDIGFCSFLENEPNLEFIPILAQKLILLVNNYNPLAKKKLIHLEDIHGYSLITYRENLPIGKTIMNLLKAHGLHATYAFDDEITIGGVVSSTDMVAITARTPFLLQFHNLKLIKLDIPADTRMIYMSYSKNNYHAKPVEIFANYILEKERKLQD
jgi:DNA-binding transcriptional LysR family regulator